MAAKLPGIDVSDSTDLLDLADEVRRSGVGRILKRGEQELAVLSPLRPPRSAASRTRRRPARPARPAPDTILNIIGISESAEPTDVARFHGRQH